MGLANPSALNGCHKSPNGKTKEKFNRMNAINVIAPYKHHGVWVFDDTRVGLQQEPFVAGADFMIDRIRADIPNAEAGFLLHRT
jgi:hypothetical protein